MLSDFKAGQEASKIEYKPIKEFNGYGVSKDGRVFSYKKDRELTQAPSKTSKYLYVRLTENGKSYHRSVHRLVAEAYIDNPNNLPEVDHIDRNVYNNNVDNLRWVDRKGNLENSSCGFVRNFRECALFYKNKLIKTFKSVNEACRYASENYGLSYTGMNKYRKNKLGFEIKSVTTSSQERKGGIATP